MCYEGRQQAAGQQGQQEAALQEDFMAPGAGEFGLGCGESRTDSS